MIVQDSHLAENLRRRELRQDLPLLFRDEGGDLNATGLDQVHAIAGIAFLENNFRIGKFLIDSSPAQLLQRSGWEATEKLAGFQRNHPKML